MNYRLITPLRSWPSDVLPEQEYISNAMCMLARVYTLLGEPQMAVQHAACCLELIEQL